MKKNAMGTVKEQDYNTTKEFASFLRVEPQTIIRGLCINGHYLGLRPVKLANNRLLWPSGDMKNIFKK